MTMPNQQKPPAQTPNLPAQPVVPPTQAQPPAQPVDPQPQANDNSIQSQIRPVPSVQLTGHTSTQLPTNPQDQQQPQSPVSTQASPATDIEVPSVDVSSTLDPNAHLTNKTYPDELLATWRRTKCLKCGYVHEGAKVLKTCPKCKNADPDKFEEVD